MEDGERKCDLPLHLICIEPILVQVIDATFPIDGGDNALEEAVERVAQESLVAVDEGYQLIVFSDRGVNAERAPISPMLIVGGAHTVLVHARKRTKIGTCITSPALPPSTSLSRVAFREW